MGRIQFSCLSALLGGGKAGCAAAGGDQHWQDAYVATPPGVAVAAGTSSAPTSPPAGVAKGGREVVRLVADSSSHGRAHAALETKKPTEDSSSLLGAGPAAAAGAGASRATAGTAAVRPAAGRGGATSPLQPPPDARLGPIPWDSAGEGGMAVLGATVTAATEAAEPGRPKAQACTAWEVRHHSRRSRHCALAAREPGGPDWLGAVRTVRAAAPLPPGALGCTDPHPPVIRLSPLDHGMMLTCINPKAMWLPYDLDGGRLAAALSYTLSEFPLLAGRLRAPDGSGGRLRRLAARRRCAFAVHLCNSGATLREAVSDAAPLEHFLALEALSRRRFSQMGGELPPYFEPMDVDAALRGGEPLLKVRLTHLLPQSASTRPTGHGTDAAVGAKVAEIERRSAMGRCAAAACGAASSDPWDGGCILAVTIHHAVLDGNSACRFLDRLAANYRRVTEAEAPVATAPPPPPLAPDSPSQPPPSRQPTHPGGVTSADASVRPSPSSAAAAVSTAADASLTAAPALATAAMAASKAATTMVTTAAEAADEEAGPAGPAADAQHSWGVGVAGGDVAPPGKGVPLTGPAPSAARGAIFLRASCFSAPSKPSPRSALRLLYAPSAPPRPPSPPLPLTGPEQQPAPPSPPSLPPPLPPPPSPQASSAPPGSVQLPPLQRNQQQQQQQLTKPDQQQQHHAVMFDRSILFPAAEAAEAVSERMPTGGHRGAQGALGGGGGTNVSGDGDGGGHRALLSSLELQQVGAVGWRGSLAAAGRLVRAVAAEERRWRGASGRSLVCEVLHLPPDQVARIKSLAAGPPPPCPPRDPDLALPYLPGATISTNDAVAALLWVLICDLRGRPPPGTVGNGAAGSNGGGGSAAGSCGGYLGLAIDLRRNGRLLTRQPAGGGDGGAAATSPETLPPGYFGNGVWCMHVPSPPPAPAPVPAAPPAPTPAAPAGDAAMRPAAADGLDATCAAVALPSTRHPLPGVSYPSAAASTAGGAVELQEEQPGAGLRCTACEIGRILPASTPAYSSSAAAMCAAPVSPGAGAGAGGRRITYCAVCSLRRGAAAVRRCVRELREQRDGAEQVLRTAASQLAAPLSATAAMMARVCCRQDAMLTSWQMPYWNLDFGPPGGGAAPDTALRNQPVQFQSLLTPSPPWSAAVMAAAPPDRAAAAAAATYTAPFTAGPTALTTSTYGTPSPASSSSRPAASGLNLFIVVPEGAAAALRCSAVLRELVPEAAFH